MLNGPLAKKILLFTLPVALSSMMKQLFNAADTAVVGLFGSGDALATVRTNTEIVALIVTISSGLSIGANIAAAKSIERDEKAALPSLGRSALVLAALIGFLGLFSRIFAAESLLTLIETPSNIFSAAKEYLQIYFLGYPFLLLYDFGAALLRAKGDSRYPFFVLIASGVINVALNLLFVLAFHKDVAGVAAATDISTAISAIAVLLRLKKDELFRKKAQKERFSLHFGADILKVGIPSAVQGAVFCFANIFVHASVNSFGSTAIAGSAVALNFEYFTYYAITAFGQTATTFVGQNYAAKKYDRCKKFFWLCLGFSLLSSVLMIAPIVLFRRAFSGLFSDELPVIESACVRILCILAFEPICNFYEIPAGALRGAGHAALPAVGTMIGTCAFRITWIYTVRRSKRCIMPFPCRGS